MEQSLAEMVRSGKITRETAVAHCFRLEDLNRYLYIRFTEFLSNANHVSADLSQMRGLWTKEAQRIVELTKLEASLRGLDESDAYLRKRNLPASVAQRRRIAARFWLRANR